VAISEGAHIIWWSEPAGAGSERLFVKVEAPSTEFTIKECYGTTETIIDKGHIVDVAASPTSAFGGNSDIEPAQSNDRV
jgi:hypothetical protein